MEAWVAKAPNEHLVPADDTSRAALNKIKIGEKVKIKFTRHRNYENHKRFFAFLKTTFDMQEHFTEMEHYRRWLIMKAGYYYTIVAPNGNTIFMPQSISFDAMEEPEFQELFSACIDVFLRELGKGITEDELRRVIDFS